MKMAKHFSKRSSGSLAGRKTSESNRTGGDAPRKEQQRRDAKRQTTKTHGNMKSKPGTGQR